MSIATTLNNTLPKDVALKHFQRFNPTLIFGDEGPIIPFIPSDNGDDKDKEERPKTVKVRLPSGADMYYLIFENGDTEDLIKHIFLHKSIVLALNLPTKIDTLTRERNGRNAALQLMDADDEGHDEAAEAIEELTRDIAAAHLRGYEMMKLILDPSLHEAWEDVVVRMCDTVNYVDENGVRHPNGPARGRLLPNLEHCYIEMVRWTTNKRNAAELQTLYENTCVKNHYTLTSIQFINRKLVMNKYRQYLPCLKLEEHSPAALTRASTPLQDVEMCPILLTGLMQPVTVAYWAYKGHGHFPTSVEDMKRDLAVIEPQVKLSLKDQGQANQNGTSGKKKGKRGNDSSSTRKQRGSSSQREKKRVYKLCEKCAKHSPEVKNSHNTEDCLKWNDDGSPRKREDRKKQWGKPKSSASFKKELHAMFTEWNCKTNKSSRRRDDDDDDSTSS
jgi:hypothetical protein